MTSVRAVRERSRRAETALSEKRTCKCEGTIVVRRWIGRRQALLSAIDERREVAQ